MKRMTKTEIAAVLGEIAKMEAEVFKADDEEREPLLKPHMIDAAIQVGSLVIWTKNLEVWNPLNTTNFRAWDDDRKHFIDMPFDELYAVCIATSGRCYWPVDDEEWARRMIESKARDFGATIKQSKGIYARYNRAPRKKKETEDERPWYNKPRKPYKAIKPPWEKDKDEKS